MSWSRRGALIGLAALAGCGFAPVHQARARGQIAFRVPQTPEGFALLERLEERFGAPQSPRYHLEVTLSVSDDSIRAAHHRTLTGQAHWTLSGAAQARGSLHHSASYLTNGTTVSGEAARRDAQIRLARGLADRITPAIWAALP